MMGVKEVVHNNDVVLQRIVRVRGVQAAFLRLSVSIK